MQLSAREKRITQVKLRKADHLKLVSDNLSDQWKQGRMIVVFIAIVGINSHLISLTYAEHALSEVWSDSDGMQMKYSTNHDDLLSTKGSELSLSTTTKHRAATPGDQEQSGEQLANERQNQQQDETAPHEQPESGTSSEGTDPTGSLGSGSTAGSSEDSNGNSEISEDQAGLQTEQGVDSSRQIPLRAQVHAQQQKFPGPPHKHRDAASNRKYEGRSAKPEDSRDEAPMSFESAQAEVGEDGSGAEQSNADPGAETTNQQSENSVSGKFQRPGRLFKEAIRMPLNEPVSDSKTTSDDGQEGSDEYGSAQQDKTVNEEPAVEVGNVKGNGGSASGNEDSDHSEIKNESSGNDEQTYNSPNTESENELQAAAAAKSPTSSERGRLPDTMIDFDQLSVTNKIRGSEGYTDGFDESNSRGISRSGHRSTPTGLMSAVGARRLHMQLAATAGQPTTGQRGPMNNQLKLHREISPPASYRSLSYFRNQVAAEREKPQNKSPDSERDNFISPGHFPGSMAHLTQAASETQKKEEPVTNNAITQTSLSSKHSGAATVQESSHHLVAASDTQQRTALPTQIPDSRLPDPHVTPEPQLQPESQQIMAPILMSTTTMAPMTAGIASATPVSVNSTSQEISSSPSLKRFKFRKYR